MNKDAFFEITDLFVSEGRCHYRIPVIAAGRSGELIVFANCRMDTDADWADEVGLVFRRADSQGPSWGPQKKLFGKQGWDGAMGTAVVDRFSGDVLLSCYLRSTEQPESRKSEDAAMAFDARQYISRDGGRTWHKDKLLVAPNTMGHGGSSHGASAGITLDSDRNKGRLLVPARFQTAPGEALKTLQRHHYNCAVYSDDQGKHWKTSEPVQVGTGEGCLVELSDGRIYYNSRAYFRDGRRRVAWSHDGGETFTDFGIEEQLPEPVHGGCNAGMALFPRELSKGKDMILFSNPAGEKRENMTVRVSFDGGRSWPVSRLIYQGPSAYSDLSVSSDGTVCLLFENGVDHPYEKISLARFNLQWVMPDRTEGDRL